MRDCLKKERKITLDWNYNMPSVNVVGFPYKSFEGDTFKFLFDGLNINNHSFEDDPTQIVNPIIFYSLSFEDGTNPIDRLHTPQEIVDFCDNLETDFILYHRSNEYFYNYYPQLLTTMKKRLYPKCNHVFRNYWNPNLDVPGITHMPLFWGKGYYKQLVPKSESEKKYKTSFIGGLKHDRADAIENMKVLGDCFVYHQSGWLSDDMMQPVEVQKIYSESVLCPHPHGNCHPATFRLAEILQSGSIPVLREYYNRDWHYKIYGEDSPLPFVKDWSELPKVYDMICEYGIEEYSQKIHNWWSSFKLKTRDNFRSIICP